MSQRANRYVLLPEEEALSGGLRWSHNGDAIEDTTGRTVVLFEELELLLEGVFAAGPVPPLPFVLTVLHHLRCDTKFSERFAPMREAIQRNTKAPSVTRHLGLLIGKICRCGPPAHNPPTYDEVKLALYRIWSDGHRSRPDQVLIPLLTMHEFSMAACRLIAAWSAEFIDHFLKFGTEPTDAGERLSEELITLPQLLASIMELAPTRQRLVGAVHLVPALEAAITLPPRGRDSQVLPQGGYADVTTHGEPDRLLLSQFALDPDDFVRRFAERELLYFKREEPQSTPPPERVIVLDQGVRTWGAVRLALAAATFALLKSAAKAKHRARLFASARLDEIDLPTTEAKTLLGVLEASDLTSDPNELIERALAPTSGKTPREFLLLTHPRNVLSPEFGQAVRNLQPNDRLFAVLVDDNGLSQFTEWTKRGPVVVRKFRLDLDAADAVRVKPTEKTDNVPDEVREDEDAWTGDIEQVTFPFRPGLIEPARHLLFDTLGEWLVAVSEHGFAQVLHDDGTVEVLPRAKFMGQLLNVITVLPMDGGFVLCGTAVVTSSGLHHVAVYYDLTKKTAKAVSFGMRIQHGVWTKSTRRQSICLQQEIAQGSSICRFDVSNPKPVQYHRDALNKIDANYEDNLDVTRIVPIVIRVEFASESKTVLRLKGNSFRFELSDDEVSDWFEPLENGKPLLAGASIHQVQSAADVFCMLMSVGNRKELRLFRWPGPTALGVVVVAGSAQQFALSYAGTKLAYTLGHTEVLLAKTATTTRPYARFHHAALHSKLEVVCDVAPFELRIGIGKFLHLFSVHDGKLIHTMLQGPFKLTQRLGSTRDVDNLGYESTRFHQVKITLKLPLSALVDRYGQVILLNRQNKPLVHFLIRRELAAAWTPGGGFWGHAKLIGGAASPNAAAAIGEAIESLMEPA